jgi:hypothetical protein
MIEFQEDPTSRPLPATALRHPLLDTRWAGF